MKKITTFLLALLLTIPAMAEISGGTYYLKPNSNWTQSNARFAVYYWTSSGAKYWLDMTKVDDNTATVYQVEIPAGTYYGMIFCRMNPGNTTNDWSSKWNQTGDITTISGNCVAINSGQWDCGSNYTVSTYTPPVVGEPAISVTYSPEIVYVNGEVTFTPTVTDVTGDYTVEYTLGEDVIANPWKAPSEKGSYTITATVKQNDAEVVSTTFTINVVVEGIYLQGTMNNWSESDDYFMPKQDGVYTWTGDLAENDKFKFVNNGIWCGATDTKEISATGSLAIGLDAGDDIIWSGAASNVTITVNAEITEMTITVNSTEEPETPVAPEVLYIRGDDMGWDSGMAMTLKGLVYSWTGTLTNGNGFKFVNVASGWDDTRTDYSMAGNVEVGSYTLTSGAGNANLGNTVWNGTTGEVTITIDFTNSSTAPAMTISQDNTTPVIPTLYILGLNNNWEASETNKMTYNEENATYSCEVELTANDEFKFNDGSNWYGYSYFTNSGNYPLENANNFKYIGADATVTITVDITNKTITLEGAKFVEDIYCEKNYYLYPNDDWKTYNAWFAAYFVNKNTGAFTWVKGEMKETNYVVFYLSKYNVPAAAPARAKAEEATDPVYTHVIFTRMNPDYQVLGWDVEEIVDNGDGTTTTNVVENRVWNQTADLTYDGQAYKITGWDESGEWVNLDDIQTAIDAVEVANGMVYAGNVVTAEGAIVVYNMSGAVVAYGEDALDLRGLTTGVYVVRNGNNVLKVVR